MNEKDLQTSPFVEKLPQSLTDVIKTRLMRINRKAEVQVYIEVEEITGQTVNALRNLGVKVQIIGKPRPDKTKGEVLAAVPTIQALLPLNMIEQLKELLFVRYVRLPDYGASNAGSVDTQGDSILQADVTRTKLGIDGTGIRVGIISTGIGGVFATGCTTCGPTQSNPSPIALGDLPNAIGTRNSGGTLVSATGGITAQSFRGDNDLEDIGAGAGGAEGTALLEIVHDLAPGATLYFANFDTQMAFEQAVDFLASNTDVVVDDVSVFSPPFDGTSPISTNTADALNNNANRVRGYFTVVGNFAQNHYAGQFVDSGLDGKSITGKAGDLHLFQGVPNVTADIQNFGPTRFDPIISVAAGSIVQVFLAWNDASGASANDYDLFLVPLACNGTKNGLPVPPCSVSGAFVASSTNPQTGTQDATETLSWTNQTGTTAAVGIVIQNVNNHAAARNFDLFVHGPDAKGPLPNHNFNTVSGSVPAQGDAGGSPVSVVSVGAISQAQCAAPANCLGSVEQYSGQGPTQTTPQSAARTKPDIVGPDQVCVTGAAGFGNGPASNCPPTQPTAYTPRTFGGTSAAASHVAAVAALVIQAAPCLLSSSNVQTPANARNSLRKALLNNAVLLPGILQSPPNNEEGSGLVNALTSANAMLPTAGAGSGQTVNATSASGAGVVLTASGSDPNSCPLTAVQWNGDCGSGTASGLHLNLPCPIGVDTVKVSVSNNGLSFSPPAPVPFTITVTDFMISASPTTASVSPGLPTIYAIHVAPTSQGSFSNPVSLTCSSGLPPGATCLFSPNSVTPAGTAGVSTLTIFTSGSGLSIRGAPSDPSIFRLRVLWLSGAAILVGILLYFKHSDSKTMFRLTASALLLFTFSIPLGCGSHGPTSSAKTYMIGVTGTSNQLQHSTNVSLTVQ